MKNKKRNIPPQYEAEFNHAMELRGLKKFKEAAIILKKLSYQKPELAATFGMLGATYWEIGDFKKAEIALRHSLRINDRSEMASVALFHTLWDSGKQDEAMEEMKRFCTLQYSEEYDLILKEINESLSEPE